MWWCGHVACGGARLKWVPAVRRGAAQVGAAGRGSSSRLLAYASIRATQRSSHWPARFRGRLGGVAPGLCVEIDPRDAVTGGKWRGARGGLCTGLRHGRPAHRRRPPAGRSRRAEFAALPTAEAPAAYSFFRTRFACTCCLGRGYNDACKPVSVGELLRIENIVVADGKGAGRLFFFPHEIRLCLLPGSWLQRCLQTGLSLLAPSNRKHRR